jgi:hypothetical protein
MTPVQNYLDNLARINNLIELSADLFRKAQNVTAERLIPNQKVTEWLRAPRQILLLAVVTLLLVTSVAKVAILIAWKGFAIDWPARRYLLSSGGIYVLEAALLILITSYVVRKGRRNERAITNKSLVRGFEAENQFFAFWPYLWVSWFFLYALLSWNSLNKIDSPYFGVAANFINNLSAMLMLSMFVELTEKTTEGADHGPQQVWLPVFLLLIVLAAAEALLYAKGFYAPGIASMFGLLSGLLVGVVTGLLIAKLTSRLFNLPITALVILTLFAVVQPVFPVLTSGPTADPGMAPFMETIGYLAAAVALYAKVALLVVIEWMRDRYGILYYMVNQARLFENERERHLSETFRQMVEKLLNRDSENDGERLVKFPTG